MTRRFLFCACLSSLLSSACQALTRKQAVRITIDTGEGRPLTRTVYINRGGTILDALWSMHRQYRVQYGVFRYQYWSVNGTMLTSARGMENNPATGKYWCLFVGPRQLRPVDLASPVYFILGAGAGLSTQIVEPHQQVLLMNTNPDGPYT